MAADDGNLRLLLAEKQQLELRLRDLEQKISVARGASSSGVRETTSLRRPLREGVLDCLSELGCPAYSQHIVGLMRCLFGREVPPTRFGPLARDEQRSFERARQAGRPRAVWLCNALTHDHGYGIGRLWVRSDWPLKRRVVGPLTGQVIYYRLASRLAELAEAKAHLAADADMLRFLAADLARDLGPRFRRGEFPLAEWRAVAMEKLRSLEPSDEAERVRAADRLRTELSEFELLFGRSEMAAVEGGGGAKEPATGQLHRNPSGLRVLRGGRREGHGS